MVRREVLYITINAFVFAMVWNTEASNTKHFTLAAATAAVIMNILFLLQQWQK